MISSVLQVSARDLRRAPLLAPLDSAGLTRLAQACSLQVMGAGEEVVSHLAEGGEVFFLLSGRLSVRLVSPIGREVLIRQLGPGAHFGEIAALTGAPRSVSVVADIESTYARCPAALFRELLAEHGEIGRIIAADLARTIVHLTDKVFELAALEMRFRIYAELLRLARAGEACEEGVRIRPAPTHGALAAAIGAQRAPVTRELRILEKEGVLRQGGRELLILDGGKLRCMLQRRAGMTASQAVDWIF